ncbi:MAG: acyloxyacyl hydrolase [Proteobacteria bacterium]|nr:acyloxyacyl hydrolase [Pseudomonadota bacterium]
MSSGSRCFWGVLLSLVCGPLSAFAQSGSSSGVSSFLYEIRGGVLAHDLHFVAASHVEQGVSLNAEAAFAPSLPILGGVLRPVLGGTFTTSGGTSWGYLDARWEYSGSLFFFGIGLGAAIHDAPLGFDQNGQKALGARVLFHIPLEVGLQVTPQNRISAYFEHSSNAYTASPNPGMDNLGIRLAHRF